MSCIRGYLTFNSKLNWDGGGKGLTDDKWKMLKVFGVSFYSSFSCEASHQLPKRILCPFGSAWAELVPRTCWGILTPAGGAGEKWGRGFLSLTVIMQLVFECSYHTNVDRLHFQSCVPGFCQYGVIVFTSLFFVSDVCPQSSGAWRAARCSTSCSFILEADACVGV